MLLKNSVCLCTEGVWLDEKPLAVPKLDLHPAVETEPAPQPKGVELLHQLYRHWVGDYPKFFKMDLLSKLGFIASELLLQHEGATRFEPREDRSVVFFNRSGSLAADSRYQETIQYADRYYPSPALFVYTLPNIVTGEIAIRNKYYGETSFFVLEKFDAGRMATVSEASFLDPGCRSQLLGWVEGCDETHWQALLLLVERDGEMDARSLQSCLERMHGLVKRTIPQ